LANCSAGGIHDGGTYSIPLAVQVCIGGPQPAGAKRLGTLIGGVRKSTFRGTLLKYFELFFEVMQHPPTTRNHTNVLQHMAGYVSENLDRTDRSELTELIDRYRRGLVPLIVPRNASSSLRQEIRNAPTW
jgi:uncharacterized protein YbgA (DUF1722 family)